MKYMKHMIAMAFSFVLNLCLWPHASASTVAFPYTDGAYTAGATTNIGQVLKQTNQGGSFLESMLDLFGINYADPSGQGKAIVFIQVIINYALALLGLIALLVILYGFYMIFFGKSDDGIAKARKTIIGATVAIIVIALSAYIVNLLFYVYNRGL